ncbi:MAG: DUF1634 domain-containing protein [Pseudomonadota bacterium]
MTRKEKVNLEASPEQTIYAGILEKGMLLGLVLLFITYALYVFGIMTPHIPVEKIPQYWNMNVHQYLETAEIKPGWSWLGMMHKGDFINFIGVTILAGVSIACYLAIIPTLLRNNDKIYAVIAVLEVVVLSLAASGILAMGGH